MAKANKRAKEAGLGEMNFHDFMDLLQNGKAKDINYLNHKLVLNKERIKRISQAEADKKKEKRKYKQLRNLKYKIAEPNDKAKKACKKLGITLQIKRGFDISRKWRNETR
jgi:hypothetical protein